MSTETNGTGSEPTLPRTREPGVGGRDTRPPSVYARLGNAKLFRPLLLLIPVVVVAVLLAPSPRRTYPTDPRLLGTPASEKIKARFDGEAVDEETTERLRREAAEGVPRVYDFDSRMGADGGKRVLDAFAVLHQRRVTLLEEHPELAGDRLSKSARAHLDALLAKQLQEALPEVEKRLGIELSEAERVLLRELGYGSDVDQVLSRVIKRAGSQPVVADRATLEPDAKLGITIQRVPEDGSPARHIEDVAGVLDLDGLQQKLDDAITREMPELEVSRRKLLARLAGRLLRPNLTLNRAATEKARETARVAVAPVTISFKKGETLIRDGDPITRRHLLIFEEMAKRSRGTSTALVAMGGALVVLILILTAFGVGRGQVWDLGLGARDILFLVALFCLMLITARGWMAVAAGLQEVFTKVPLEAYLFVIPVAAGAMITRLVLRQELALLFAVTGSVVLAMMVQADRSFYVFALVGSVLGTTTIRTMSRRSDLLRAGVWVGAGQAVMAVALLLLRAESQLDTYLWSVPMAFASGILAAFVALAMTSVVELIFGYSTDLQLLELANLNHPALKELIVQAPGSYHHSIIVGSLVEAAAEAVGANPLLARVMAYYHDIGKGCNPSYFVDNQRGGQNPHDKLKPSMSAMIIRRHVTDGLELARRHRLGEQIAAGIAEHHGNTLIQYFYQKAKENEDPNNPVFEGDYRYPGRKPQSREAALVMLGDSVEAASRSLAEPTPARLQGLVNRLINGKFTDGQLDECDLTLKDLHTIAKAFTRVLNSIYHERPEYPGGVTDLTSKRQTHNGDLDPKATKRAERADGAVEEDRPDNLRRLGLD